MTSTLRTTVLVAEDEPSLRQLLTVFLERLGFDVVVAADGKEALTRFREHSPDIILADISMPEMSGLEVVSQVHRESRSTPVMFMSGDDTLEAQVAAIEAGGYDILAKPIRFPILQAKMANLRRLVIAQHTADHHPQTLKELRETELDDQRMVKALMERLSTTEKLPASVYAYQRNSQVLGGDAVLCQRSPSGNLFVMVADATGHGLPAAFTLVPLIQAFREAVLQEWSMPLIVTELNRRCAWFPIDRFVALSGVCLDFQRGTLTVWNAGNPPIRLVSQSGDLHLEFPSAHPPLGVLRGTRFDASTTEVLLPRTGFLFFASDGLEDTREITFTDREPVHEKIARLKNEIDQLPNVDDDITLALINLKTEAQEQTRNAKLPTPERRIVLYLAGQLHGATLSNSNFEPFVEQFGRMAVFSTEMQAAFGLVVGELFSNALDHGILGMSSITKQGDHGLWMYEALREDRLRILDTGMIELKCTLYDDDQGSLLEIEVTDSGPGFDSETNTHDRLQHSGRGLQLVRHFAESVEIRPPGNCVIAYLRLNKS